MDSFELNKVLGAVLGTLLFVMGSGFIAELLIHGRPAGVAGYALPEMPETPAAGGAAPAKEEPLPVLLASANAEKGAAAARKCAACHIFDKSGANKVGPGLYGIVNHGRAQHAGFNYSAALKGKGGEWTFENLNEFIKNPKGAIPGTIMAFAGISSPTERADLLAYLRTLSDSPAPLPTP
jgi:cytochrome c